MDLKALIAFAVWLTSLSIASGKVTHPAKKQNDKTNHPQHDHSQQLERLNQMFKHGQDQQHVPSEKKDTKTPLGREQLPLPLVLSPDKIHNMDLNPAFTIAMPPKSSSTKAKASGRKKMSELTRRQVQYDSALASLLEDALRTAASVQPVGAGSSHEEPLHPAAHVYHATPSQPIAFAQTPTPFEDVNHAVPGLTEAIIKPPVLLKTHHFPVNHEEHDEFKNYAAKYQFGYRVVDTHSGNDFGQTESRNGGLTTGHYHVLLPDGRLQTVQYWSDLTGFHAHISYDKHAIHI